MTESSPEPPEGSATATPILVAVGLAVLAVVAVIGLRALRGDEVRAEAGVGRAVVGQNDALQREDYGDFRRFTCTGEQGSETAVLAAQRLSADAKGARFVDDVRAVTAEGDRASATVVYHFEKSADDKITTTMSFIRENGEWKVCSPGPR